MEEFLKQWGLPGAIILGLSGYVLYLHKLYSKKAKDYEEASTKRTELMAEAHKLDRDEFKQIAKDGQQIAKDGFEQIKESTSIISSLKTLFEISIKQNKT